MGPKCVRTCTRIGAFACPVALVFVLGPGAPLDARQASRTSNQQDPRTDPAVLALEITSPANVTVVAPGDPVTVKVTSARNTRFQGVSLLAERPLNIGAYTETLPAQFSLRIPIDTPCQKYVVSGFGVTLAGQIFLASIVIDVERRDMPASLEPRSWEADFDAEGESDRFHLLARFADGAVLDVTESTRVTYTSGDPNVATVESDGTITAVAEGETEIVATYGPPSSGVHAAIYVNVAASHLSVVPRAIAFGNKIIGTSTTQQMTVTNVSSDMMKIRKLSVSAPYSETDNCPRSSPLSPGASCAIAVTFAPTSKGPSEGIVTVETDFHIIPPAFKLTGTGVPR